MKNAGQAPIVNAMSVDVEDHFHVSALAAVAPRHRWDEFAPRVVDNTLRLLDIFAAADTKATFFILGWVAARHVDLVRRIAAGGHEIASHGFHHELVYDLSPEKFREDVHRAKTLLEDQSGVAVRGYRAPSFSITARNFWAFDVLIETGHGYDASIFPVVHDRYGVPGAPRHLHVIPRSEGRIDEVPPATVRLAGVNFPIAGGGYFRLFPYGWTAWGFRRLNDGDRRPGVFYLHPWEIDPDQPRLPVSGLSRLRHYGNLQHTEQRLQRLLREFRFAPIRDLIASNTWPETAVHYDELAQ